MSKKETRIYKSHSVCDIDFKELVRHGIECVLLDIEGTITAWDHTEVPQHLRTCLRDSGIRKIGLVTNMSAKKSDRLPIIAKQVGAQTYAHPQTRTQRKPRSYMLKKCMADLDVDKNQTIMIGDKLLDALAAKRAGVAAMYWVDKLDGPDHWFDRLVYRKIEPLFKRILARGQSSKHN